MANRPDHIDLESGPRVDWGDALSVPVFYGREEEQALLSRWVVGERCRVVSVLGMGGIGKSALVMNVTLQLMMHFEVVIVRSLRDAPSCEALLDDCLRVLSSQEGGAVGNVGSSRESVGAGLAPDSILQSPDSCALWEPLRQESLEQRISLLLSHLRKVRALVVLDNLEGLLEARDVKGHLRPGFEGYGQLLLRVAETGHRSCLLLTSREKPAELRLLEGRYPLVHSLRLVGLDIAACKRLLEEKEVVGTSSEQERLIGIYAGNPLALKIVAQAIVDVFSCKIGPFLAGDMVIFSSITDLLDEQFARLSAQEQSVLYWLAIMREPVTFDELHEMLVIPQPRVQLLEAVDASYRRSLIERGKRPGSFTLQSVVLEYVTMLLIAEAASEIQQCRLNKLIQYSLELAHAKEYVRQTQQRLLVGQLLADLQSKYPRRADRTKQEPRTVPTAPLEEQLLSLLNDLREENYNAQGYGPTNLIALLRAQRKHLSGLNLSQLSIRGAYLQGIKIQDAKLSSTLMRDTVLTEAVNATWSVAISPDGRWWAAGSIQGQVRVWEEESQTLHLIWQAHSDAVYSLAFSPDGRALGSGSTDGTVKLWDVETGALLWTGRQQNVNSLAFTPDGSLLVSGGADATVQLWDPQSGRNLQTLMHPSQVRAVAFSPDGRLLVSGCDDGKLRLWERRKTESSTWIEILSVQTNWVTSLAFAPDGRTLASAHFDRTVKLWEVESLRLLHTLSGLQARRIAWSPDGRVLASYCDKTIWLWDAGQGRCRAVLHGHSADVYSLTFAPDGSRLLSGSADGTLRVWNVENCQCVRVIAGYGIILLDLDWSPDGTQLVSGGSDALVTIWDVSGETAPRVLRGHSWIAAGVGWSPDGRFVASCGWDMTLRLWDATSGVCVQRFEDTSGPFISTAWSPDGTLLASGCGRRGVQVWDVRARSLLWVGQPPPTMFLHVSWSPDGTRLAGAGDDGSVYLWESVDGTSPKAQGWRGARPLPTKLSGHEGWVTSVEWSPDGEWLASGSASRGSGELFIWDAKTGERVQTFVGHTSEVYELAWSPRGDLLVTGGGDGKLRWWDVLTGECVSMREAHRGPIRSLKVSPDRRRLASCGNDGAIRIWDICSDSQRVQGKGTSPLPTPTAPPLLRTLRHDRPYERLNITGIRGLNEAQKASLLVLGAIDEAALRVEEGTMAGGVR